MMVRVVLLVAAFAQSGCAVAIYGESRKVTRAGITPVLARLLPAVPTEGAADCVMKSLTQIELVSLPNSGTFENPARAEAFVKGALVRPGVGACIAALPKAAG